MSETELRSHAPAMSEFRALGTTAKVVVNGIDVGPARELVVAELALVDSTCSRFRDDSELSRVNRSAGTTVRLTATFTQYLEAALRAARITGGAVDPTVGRALVAIGYDRDFAAVEPEGPGLRLTARRVPGWEAIEFDPDWRTLRLPPGVALDFGATAKALAADRCAERAAAGAGQGVLVSLGGDIRVAGPAPPGGWSVLVADDHQAAPGSPGQTVSIASGGLATSSTQVRAWRRGGEILHHIVDPRTGLPARSPWRTVSVAAATCLDANIASTAAIVMGDEGIEWLGRTGLPARLVPREGAAVALGGWPGEA